MRRRARLTVMIVAAAVLLAAIPAVLLIRARNPDRLSVISAQDQLVPFSFKHPSSWERGEFGVNVVFSPSARELAPLFSQKGTGGTWRPVRERLRLDPARAVGLATSFSSTQLESGTSQLRDSVQLLLPVTATFSSGPEQLLVGGYAADQLEGELADPDDTGTRLHFLAVVVHVQRPNPKTAYLVFFAPRERFESRHALFDEILGTVSFA
jgi:hypothetical protein